MKNLILILGIICFIANAIIGMVITSYAAFNVMVTSIVIAVNTFIMYGIVTSSVKDGFKISLTLLLPIIALIELILGVIAPEGIENNWYVIILTLLLAGEAILYATAYGISNVNK